MEVIAEYLIKVEDFSKILATSLREKVVDKIIGAQLNTQEIYLKVVGGLKINEPSIDLGIAISLLSSFKNQPIINKTVFIGEIGLTGEIRPVSHIEQRLAEINKLGFKKVFLPKANLKNIKNKFENLSLVGFEYINEIYQRLSDIFHMAQELHFN